MSLLSLSHTHIYTHAHSLSSATQNHYLDSLQSLLVVVFAVKIFRRFSHASQSVVVKPSETNKARMCNIVHVSAVSGDQPDKGRSGVKRTGQVGEGERKRGTGSVGPKKHNGRKRSGDAG